MASKNYGLTGVGSTVELGKGGAKLKNNAGAVEARNTGDTAFAVLRAGDPSGLDDVVNLRTLKTQGGSPVIGQINGGSPPAAGTPGRLYVCTTTGGAYTVNYVYLDDGAAWVEFAPYAGMTMNVTVDLTGGAIEFTGDHAYMWDADGGSWVDIGPTALSATKQVLQRSVDIAYTDSGAINVGAAVSANGRVSGIWVNVTQVFNGTTPTLIVGDAGNTSRLALAAEIDLKTVGLYKLDASHLYSVSTQVTATLVPDSSTTGAVNVTLHYAEA
jgi:hypothetical protein